MKKKLLSIVLVSMFIFTAFASASNTKILKSENTSIVDQNSTDSIKVNEIVENIIDYLNELQISDKSKSILRSFILLGLKNLEKIDIDKDVSISDSQDIINERGIFGRTKNKFVLINYRPDNVILNVTLPTKIINLSDENQTSNRTLEIFVKLIPFIDVVETEQRVIIRKLYQSSVIWPAIGARIVEDDETSFILAFGINIKWSWKLL